MLLIRSLERSIDEKKSKTAKGIMTLRVKPAAEYVVKTVNNSEGVIYAITKNDMGIARSPCKKVLSGNLAKLRAPNINAPRIIQRRYLAIFISRLPSLQFANKSEIKLVEVACPVTGTSVFPPGTKLSKRANKINTPIVIIVNLL